MGFRRPLDNPGRHLHAVDSEPNPVRDSYERTLAAVSEAIEQSHRAAALRRKRQGATRVSIEEDIQQAEFAGDRVAAEYFLNALDAYEEGLKARRK